jgi:hypothetical protein
MTSTGPVLRLIGSVSHRVSGRNALVRVCTVNTPQPPSIPFGRRLLGVFAGSLKRLLIISRGLGPTGSALAVGASNTIPIATAPTVAVCLIIPMSKLLVYAKRSTAETVTGPSTSNTVAKRLRRPHLRLLMLCEYYLYAFWWSCLLVLVGIRRAIPSTWRSPTRPCQGGARSGIARVARDSPP